MLEMKDLSAAEILELLRSKDNVVITETLVPPTDAEFDKSEQYGNMFLLGNTIYMLKCWPDELLVKFYNGVGQVLWDEIVSRGLNKDHNE